jgi:hypothetical protein
VDEVLAALLAGDLPARWAHVYTYAQHFHHPRPGSLRQWPWLTSPRPAQWQQTFHCDDREALQTGSSEPRGKSINALGSCIGWVGWVGRRTLPNLEVYLAVNGFDECATLRALA